MKKKVNPPNVKKLEKIMKKNKKDGKDLIYLFLDFDGVINVFLEPGTEKYEKMMARDPEDFNFADEESIENLNRFCEDFNVKVIISSSWRFGLLPHCIDYLTKAGMKEHVQVTDTTQMTILQPRENDIEMYLLEHPDYTDFLIFDDINMKNMPGHMVWCDPLRGWDAERDQYARKLIKER